MENFIRNEFEKIKMPQDCAEEIRQLIEEAQTVRAKNSRILPRILIAAAAALILLSSVAAVGIHKGWLDDFLGSSENADGVTELQLEARDGDMGITFDRMLTDGPFLYLQVSVRTAGDVNAAEAFEKHFTSPESNIQERLSISYDYKDQYMPISEQQQNASGGEMLSFRGPVTTWCVSRLDDGSDMHFCSYTMQILMAELPADYEGTELTLRLYKHRSWMLQDDGGYTTEENETPIIEEPFILSNSKARAATMEDGRNVKVHTLGVQIQGADFAVWDTNGEWHSGVILQDGRKLPFNHGFGATNRFAEEMQWSICPLGEIIDPQDVVAIYVGEVIYPLN